MARSMLMQLLALLCCLQLHGQVTPEILTTKELKRGIYKNYSEFLKNSPSIQDTFSVFSRSREAKIIHGDASYHLIMSDSAVRRRDMKKIWGVCDGSAIFVNELPFTGTFTFRKMHGLGRYCFLMGSEPSSVPIIAPISAVPLAALAAGGAIVGMGTISFGEMFYLLNINNGKFFPLSPKTLESIFEKDQKLLHEYQSPKRNGREDVMVDFIKKYNASHLHEADMDLWFGRDVAIYRRGKREFPEPFRLTVNDTLDLQLQPNKVYQFQTDGETIKLCVGAECKIFSLFRTGVTYILAQWKNQTSSPFFLSIPPEDGKKDIRAISELENAQIKKPE